jgi:DNA-binding FadR family transcriptional regulator
VSATGAPLNVREASRTSLVEQVIAEIDRLIDSGSWPVGAKIPPEPELTAAFGVGRNTLREAVRALGYAGLLEVRQGDGTYVRADSDLGAALQRRLRRGSVTETVEVRHSCERLAARLAAERRTDEDLQRIAAAVHRKREADADAGADADDTARVEADIAFHLAVVAATHNSVLIDLYANLVTALRSTVEVSFSLGADRGGAFDHVELADAIRRGDPRAAELAVDEHIAALRRALDDPQP